MISLLAYLVREGLAAEPVLALHVASAWSVWADVSTSSELTTGGTSDGSTGITTDAPAYKGHGTHLTLLLCVKALSELHTDI